MPFDKNNPEMVALVDAINAVIDQYNQLDFAHQEDAILGISPIEHTVSLVDADDMIAADVLGEDNGFDDTLDLHDFLDLMEYDESDDNFYISQNLVQDLAASYFEE
jgi:hypothetical protein